MVLQPLEAERSSVVVSLPRNEVELAEATVEAGADAVKTHPNAVHQASKTASGSLDEESDALKEILTLDVPGGGVSRQDVETIRPTLPDLMDLDMDFVDASAYHMPPEIWNETGLTTWVAPNSEYDYWEFQELARMDVDAIELALFKEQYGVSLSTREAAKYVDVTHELPYSTVVPTQLALTPRRRCLSRRLRRAELRTQGGTRKDSRYDRRVCRRPS